MIRPTSELLKILKPYNIKLTVYVDIGYLESAFRQQVDLENARKVAQQLKELQEQGHDLQLHVHID